MFGMLFAGSDNDSLSAYPVERPTSRPSQPLPGHDFMESHASLARWRQQPRDSWQRGEREEGAGGGRCRDLDRDLWVDGAVFG